MKIKNKQGDFYHTQIEVALLVFKELIGMHLMKNY